MIGEKLNQYEIKRVLGVGGMATVYLAYDTNFQMEVAIKVLKTEFVYNSNIRKRFIAEAKNMRRMDHHQIIKVTDLIDAGDIVAFVMEYINGKTIKELVAEKKGLNDKEIKDVLLQMLDSLKYVHAKGLIHRDVKPSNFLITTNGKVKLTDFGIAKSTDPNSSEYTMTGTSQQMGTPLYMSPEQITSTKAVTKQTDIYSLGVLLWFMVTNRNPYDESSLSFFQMQMEIVQTPLPESGTAWDEIIGLATKKNVTERFKNTDDFRKAVIAHSSRPKAKPKKNRKLVLVLFFALTIIPGVSYVLFKSGDEPLKEEVEVIENDNAVIEDNEVLLEDEISVVVKPDFFKVTNINSQIWQVQNLNIEKFKNGDSIPHASTQSEWRSAARNNEPAWCYFGNTSENNDVYGKLYNWYAVNDPRGLAPDGWHIASKKEYLDMIHYIGGYSKAGDVLKSQDNWMSGGVGLNSVGFNALAGGYRDVDGTFTSKGKTGYWWCSTSPNNWDGHSFKLSSKNSNIQAVSNVKSCGFSVRCIQDNSEKTTNIGVEPQTTIVSKEKPTSAEVRKEEDLEVAKKGNDKMLEMLDSDQDGLFNKDDDCPNIPGPVSNHGCPVFDEAVVFDSSYDLIKKHEINEWISSYNNYSNGLGAYKNHAYDIKITNISLHKGFTLIELYYQVNFETTIKNPDGIYLYDGYNKLQLIENNFPSSDIYPAGDFGYFSFVFPNVSSKCKSIDLMSSSSNFIKRNIKLE